MISVELQSDGKHPEYDAILSRFVVLAAQKIRRRMRERMEEPKTGRLYARKKGESFLRFHRASAPGESPAKDTGAYSRSLEVVRKSSVEAAIETNLDYPEILETKKNRPLWLVSVKDVLPELEEDLRRMFEAGR